jgi:uncharacterized metal-binding protein YceD (DUF177 family)
MGMIAVSVSSRAFLAASCGPSAVLTTEKSPVGVAIAFSAAADPTYFIDEGWLDLRQPLREQILLTLPMHPLCRPDCKGLCSTCGHNLNEGPCNCSTEEIDPRLADLKKLL